MKRSTRRQLLKAGLGAGAVALFDRLGAWPRRRAYGMGPTGDKPSRLLTIYVPGGWVPFYLWCPFSSAEIGALIPPTSQPFNQDRIYFEAVDVSNLDGTGDATDPLGFPRLRVPRTWNEALLSAGQPAPNNANGWSWVEHQLWNHCSVVHGVDMGSAAHASALISMLSGVAAPFFKSPSLAAWVAASLHEVYGDQRPLGSVTLSATVNPAPQSLGPTGAPTVVSSLDSLQTVWSEGLDQAWEGLRNRTAHQYVDYWGTVGQEVLLSNDLEELVSKRMRERVGTTTAATDGFFSEIYDSFQDVSRSLAADVVSVIDQTAGLEHLQPAFWNATANGLLALQVNSNNTSGAPWTADFDLALRLLKSDLTTAVTMRLPGLNGFYYDTHSIGHAVHYQQLRGTFDVIGRMLAEMSMTPVSADKSLLDDTLVIIASEFGRTFPMSGTCDHWPYNSVCFAGGGVAPNRMCGGYDVDLDEATALGFPGLPVALIDEDGNTQIRQPLSIDLVYSALALFGLDDIFLPGGPGRVLGLVS